MMFLVSLFRIGCIIGAVSGGVIVRYFGPKKVIMLTAIPTSLSWMPIIFATNAWELCMGRFFFGLFCSIATPGVVVYIAESVSPHIRGIMMTSSLILTLFGVLLAYSVGYVLRWKMQAVIQSVLPLVQLAVAFFPESPRWLVMKKKPDKAKRSLLRLRSQKQGVSKELEEMMLNMQKNNEENWSDLFQVKYLKPLFIVFCNTYFLDFNGYFFMSSFMVIIFQESGGMVMEETLATVLVGIFQFFGIIVSAVTIDRYGRRPLMITSLLGMGLTQSALALYYYLHFFVPKLDIDAFEWMPLASVLITATFYAIGIGNLYWMLFGELFPLKIRSMASGISTAWNSVLMFIVLQSFFFLKKLLTLPGLFAFSSFNCFLGVAFTYKFLPETLNMPLEEIEALWK